MEEKENFKKLDILYLFKNYFITTFILILFTILNLFHLLFFDLKNYFCFSPLKVIYYNECNFYFIIILKKKR
jgi:hypothetical protein